MQTFLPLKLQLVRTVEGFDHLYLMATAIKGSVGILAWALVLLFTIQMTIGLVVGQVLQVSHSGFDRFLVMKWTDVQKINTDKNMLAYK